MFGSSCSVVQSPCEFWLFLHKMLNPCVVKHAEVMQFRRFYMSSLSLSCLCVGWCDRVSSVSITVPPRAELRRRQCFSFFLFALAPVLPCLSHSRGQQKFCNRRWKIRIIVNVHKKMKASLSWTCKESHVFSTSLLTELASLSCDNMSISTSCSRIRLLSLTCNDEK